MGLEYVIAIPKDSLDIDGDAPKFLKPERIDRTGDFARECGQGHFKVSPSDQGIQLHKSIQLYIYIYLYVVCSCYITATQNLNMVCFRLL